MRESDIEKAVCDYAKKRGLHCYKFVSPGTRGVPDRMFTYHGGIVFFIEFKKPGETPRADQIRVIERMVKHEVPVFIIDDIEIGKEIIDELVDDYPVTPLSVALN